MFNQEYFGQTLLDQPYFGESAPVEPPYEGPVGAETLKYIRLTRNRMVQLHFPGE